MFGRRPLVNVANAQKVARARLPESVYDFLIGDTHEGLTTAGNLKAFRDLHFRPRAGIVFKERKLETTVLGSKLAMPVAIAPAGVLRLARRHGYILTARAAGRAGIPMGVSTMADDDIYDIAAATKAPVWYQVYQAGGAAATEVAIERAKRAGCTALIVTMDTPARGFRDSLLLGRGTPVRITLKQALNFFPECVVRPSWTLDYLRDGLSLKTPNVRVSVDGPMLPPEKANLYKTPPSWADFARFKKLFNGPVAAKGILTPEDAKIALDHGADAIIVSNHGGFQLDSAPATLRVLPSIVDAVGHRTEVLLDSGVRRGQDVVKALALGAKAVLIGRAYVWPLAARGEAGVEEILGRFRAEIDRTLAFLGCEDVRNLDSSYVNWSESPLD
jgi:isopentenyl diphosphate isomerase/L-lactate dehydrogenase-like FMN-dependent dehydrogenase